jgi:hypothetical protein
VSLQTLNQIPVETAEVVGHDCFGSFAYWQGTEATAVNFFEVGVVDLSGTCVFSEKELGPDI